MGYAEDKKDKDSTPGDEEVTDEEKAMDSSLSSHVDAKIDLSSEDKGGTTLVAESELGGLLMEVVSRKHGV